MSFRRRLVGFFAIIVVVPLLAVGAVLFALVADSENGKADARLAGGLEGALAEHEDAIDAARPIARRVARDSEITAALDRDDIAALAERVREIAARGPDGTEIAIDNGGSVQDTLPDDSVAPALVEIAGPDGSARATVLASVTSARRLATSIADASGLDARVVREGGVLASTILEDDEPEAEDGDVRIADEDLRARYQTVDEGPLGTLRLGVLADREAVAEAITERRLVIGLVLAGFLLLALGSSTVVARALQAQVGELLEGARRLAAGDFSQPVPAQGRDEFAALGQEFNNMSVQLERRIAEVERGRRELEQAIRGAADAFATGLDRNGIADLAVRTAIRACAAGAARLVLAAEGRALAEEGAAEAELAGVLAEAEEASAGANAPAAASEGEARALAIELRGAEGPIGTLAIARSGRPFDSTEHDLLSYLAGQAAVSLENAELHAAVSRQAITDDLTGLANQRRFREQLSHEVDRALRFGGEVSLVVIDLDDFKRVNDEFGHQQGDLVLAEAGKLLRHHSRGLDEPARYGGEELAIVLPQTGQAGAILAAERLRAAFEQMDVERIDGGRPLRVTASFGVASLPSDAKDARGLFAAADSALYRAKREGKNRVERARGQ